jgi:two-component system sensor histidine kinase QseC
VADQATRIDASTLRTRFPADDIPAELVPICARLNELLARLEASFDRERRFSADVAHELRTPIAELRSLAEVALKWPPGPDESRENFEEARAIARRMESLVIALQAIARSESGGTVAASALIRLPGFIERIWTGFSSQATQRRLRVEFDLPAGARVVSDPVLLESLLANLFANAVEYTPPEGSLSVAVRPGRDGQLTITIANDTNDLRAEDLPRLFDRFWRKDRSRTDTRHSGLGLSLVRAIAGTLGASVSAELLQNQKLLVRIAGLTSRAAEDIAPNHESALIQNSPDRNDSVSFE